MEKRAGKGGRGFPGDSMSPLRMRNHFRNKVKKFWSKKELTPGPRQVDTSGDEEADKEGEVEEEVRHQ